MAADLANPGWLWLFAALPLVALRVAAGQSRRRRDWSALGRPGRPPRDGSLLRLTAWALLVLALARPRWGAGSQPPLPAGHDVVLAVDVSRSMGAQDAVPDRLGLAVEEAVSLVRSLGVGASRGDRAAVVAFAGRGVLRCPLTPNLGAVVDALHGLRAGDIRPGGTDLAAALDAALEAFDPDERAGGRAVVVLSDGEDHNGRWRDAAERARAQGVVVHAVAIGDAAQGQLVPLRTASGTVPLIHEGEPVLSRRTDEPLRAVAEATGGAFVPLGLTSADLGRLYRDRIEPVAAGARRGPGAPEPAERFAVPLLAALGLVLASCRTRAEGRALWGPARAWRLAAVALVGLLSTGAGRGDDPGALVERGREAYAAGRHAEALQAFRAAAALAPGSAVARFDEGAALFRLGRLDEARDAYAAARERADPALRIKIDFALGNTALGLRALGDALRHYDACLASNAVGAESEEVRRRARVNREFVEALMRQTPSAAEEPTESPSPDARRPGAGRPEDRGPETAGGGTPPNPAAPTERPGDDGRPGRRGPGGAGGSGPAPPGSGTPEEQLARAMDHVREARRQRLQEPPPTEVSRDLKDW